MDELREQCPWDKKQTIQTLRPQTLEEVYELTDAITDNDWNGLKEELGDVLLHIVFYSRIGEEQEKFTLDEVIEGVFNKLVARHPHIYSNVKVDEEILELYAAVATGVTAKIEDEFGDVLFALVNYARYLDVDPENALERTNKKFIKRFSYIEAKAKEAGKDLQHMTLEEMDELWNQAKQSE